ncbi:MAG TPA: alpha/beta hydrolase domain-containing protein, partial [Nakamurella sp.]
MQHITVEGPLTGRPPIGLAGYDLGALGYEVQEWLLRGTARSFSSPGALRPDGRWDARPAGTADFVTRLVVVRPADPGRFDGTVLVEWLNVTYGQDIPAEWLYTHRHLMRSDAVWVGVSVQHAGIRGGGFLRGDHLQKVDPERYAVLSHPGDAYSYDIFSQAAAAVRRPDGPLRGLRPRTVLGTGTSQSAMYLTTYVNAIDPIAQVVDGFLIHGRGVRGAWVEGTLLDPRRLMTDLIRHWQPALPGHRIRPDARVPVLTLQGETDVVLLGSGLARQRDGDGFRLWELAGAAHFDSYGMRAGFFDDGSLPTDALRHKLRPLNNPAGFHTSGPSNSGPQLHYVLQAAVEGLRRWVVDGVAPASADVLATRRFQPLRLARDRAGIAIGGVRTPWVSAPVATLSGLGQRT